VSGPRADPAGDTRAVKGRRSGLVALLVPPVAWFLALSLSYLVEDFNCTAAATADDPTPATGLKVTLLVLHGILLVVAVVAGLLGWRATRSGGSDRGRGDVARFTGSVGAGLSLVFAFGIVLIAWNVLVLEVCG
jgi:hypothetical protein